MPRMTNDKLLWQTAMSNKARLDELEKKVEMLVQSKPVIEKRGPGRPRKQDA